MALERITTDFAALTTPQIPTVTAYNVQHRYGQDAQIAVKLAP